MKLGEWKIMIQAIVYANLAPINLLAAMIILDNFNGNQVNLNVVNTNTDTVPVVNERKATL